MSTQAERQTASIKELNSLLRGDIDPSLTPIQQQARRRLVQQARAAFLGDDSEPDPQPPKVCPMSRADLRKVISAAVQNGFDETVAPYQHVSSAACGTLAVGCAELFFNESDPVFLMGTMTYRHGEATRAESDAILNRMFSVLVSDHMGPAAEFVQTLGGHADYSSEKFFRVDFQVRCPA